MADDRKTTILSRLLREKVGDLASVPRVTTPADYEEPFRNALRRARQLEGQVQRNQLRMATTYSDLVDQPAGRQATVLQNSNPEALTVLAHGLMRRSFGHRFSNPTRSLALAELALRAVALVTESEFVSTEFRADLGAEALCHMANAKRITSDFSGAEKDLLEAESLLARGTGARDIRADFLSFFAGLRHAQGFGPEAAALLDREIALRRLLGDPERLGVALIDRGRLACIDASDLHHAGRVIKQGVELVEDHTMMFLGLLHLAEAWARSGDGPASWKLLCTSELVAILAHDLEDGLDRRRRWTKGIAYRALGETDASRRLLGAVHDEFIEEEQPLLAAFVALDLMAALAADGESVELERVARATHLVFSAERLQKEALGAYLVAHRAALENTLTEALAVKVANFVVRHHNNPKARFDV